MREPVSVVVPAHNAEATITPCLAALRIAMQTNDELILFDDGSTDATCQAAEHAGARILTNSSTPKGPAHGRNRGAELATRRYVLFVDADVIIHRDAIDHLVKELVRTGAAAAFGSYDDHPHSSRLPAIYANLRHHFVHQNGSVEATTFWSGIGIVDRETFRLSGGFNDVLFPFPSIEDVELGIRLVKSGHKIRLVPEAQGTHWKDWTLWRVWHTDVFRRALPWSRLIAEGQLAQADLNLAGKERLLALLAVLVLSTAAIGIVFQPVWLVSLAALALYLLGIHPFLAVVGRRTDALQLVGIACLHFCYHLYASATYASVMLTRRVTGLFRLVSPGRRRLTRSME